MSLFVTKIPVDVDSVIALLPVKSDVHEVSLVTGPDGQHHVELQWGNDWLKTQFTVPTEYKLGQLLEGKLPEKTVDLKAKALERNPVGDPEPVLHSPITPKKGVDKPSKQEHKTSK